MRRVSSALIASALATDSGLADPLHRQLYDKLREEILAGRFAAGQRMPSTRVLAADLGIARNTILHAFEQLKAEGYFEGETGSGTYVARALPEKMMRVTSVAANQGNVLSTGRRLSRFASRITGDPALFIRPALYRPFQPGFPALDAFPFDIWTRLIHRHRNRPSGELLGYGSSAGYMPLRKAIASYLAMARGVRCEADQVVVVSGTQQALNLSARLLIDPGDTVWMEEPGYRGAQAAFHAVSAKLVPVPVDEEGLDISKKLASGSRARLVYTTPSHQFPMGSAMTAARRLLLANWASESGTWILEDDYDSEFRYSSSPLPSLQSLDRSGSVIYLGTFSKVLFPGLRLGYLVVPPGLADAFLKAKAVTDFHCSTIEQAVAAEFIEEGHFSRHIRRMRTLYLERLECILEAARTEMAGTVEIQRPDAGMHVLAKLAPGVDDVAAARAAGGLGISSMPLSTFYIGKRAKTSGLLLGYAGYNSRQIRLGMRRLSGVLN